MTSHWKAVGHSLTFTLQRQQYQYSLQPKYFNTNYYSKLPSAVIMTITMMIITITRTKTTCLITLLTKLTTDRSRSLPLTLEHKSQNYTILTHFTTKMSSLYSFQHHLCISGHFLHGTGFANSPVFFFNLFWKRTHTHTTVLWLCGFCPGQAGWAGTRRNIHPLTLIVVINHPYMLSPSTTIHGILPIPCWKRTFGVNWHLGF